MFYKYPRVFTHPSHSQHDVCLGDLWKRPANRFFTTFLKKKILFLDIHRGKLLGHNPLFKLIIFTPAQRGKGEECVKRARKRASLRHPGILNCLFESLLRSTVAISWFNRYHYLLPSVVSSVGANNVNEMWNHFGHIKFMEIKCCICGWHGGQK